MSIGEPFKGEQRIFDWTDVQRTHILVLSSIFFFLIVLTIGLFSIYLIQDIILLSLFSFIFQALLGIILTRVYHDKGTQAKSDLRLMEPSSLDNQWTSEYILVHNEEISRIFERMISQVEKMEGNPTDDTTDLAWFAVAVWSTITSVVVLVFGPITILMFVSAMVVSSILLGSYYSAYANSSNGDFSELLSHLEYYIITKTDHICTHCECDTNKIVEWRIHDKSFVLSDFFTKFEIIDCNEITLQYQIGLPKNEEESYWLQCKNVDIFHKLKESVMKKKDLSWRIDVSDELMRIKLISNLQSLTFENPLTFLRLNSEDSETIAICNWLIRLCESLK